MPPTHLTLEEAAERLGISPEEFKKNLKTHPAFRTLVPVRDGSTLRFKAAAIDELARELGAGSNPENPLPTMPSGPPPDSDDFEVPTHKGPSESRVERKDEHKEEHKHEAKKEPDEPLKFADEGDEFSLAPDEAKPAAKKPGKGDSDSDVRLDGGKTEGPKTAPKMKSERPAGDEAVPTEELSLDFSGPSSAVIKGGSSAKLSAPKSSGKLTSDSGKSLAKPGAGDSSEFELSLDGDSDDFELKLNTDSSDEVALGEMPKDKDVPSSSRRASESGILSRKPADSGISLEKGKGKETPESESPAAAEKSDPDIDFELTLDSSAAVSGTKLGGMKGKKIDPESDSEFELTLDDSGESSLAGAALGEAEESKGDIFETDFEIPPMDESGSEAVALDSSDTDLEKSDFDVAIDDGEAGEGESGSEVVLLEDEDGEAPAPKSKAKLKKAVAKKAVEEEEEGDVDLADVEAAEEEEDDGSAAKALKGVKGKRRDDEEEDEEEAAVPAGAGAYRPVPWGIWPAFFLLPAMVLVLLGGLMGFELLSTMWGYQQPRKPAAPLVRALAGQLDMELKDQ
jgi:hypothetical protein